jgi:protein-S-isoprenylcysteine O-methyltransferase Ste14
MTKYMYKHIWFPVYVVGLVCALAICHLPNVWAGVVVGAGLATAFTWGIAVGET